MSEYDEPSKTRSRLSLPLEVHPEMLVENARTRCQRRTHLACSTGPGSKSPDMNCWSIGSGTPEKSGTADFREHPSRELGSYFKER